MAATGRVATVQGLWPLLFVQDMDASIELFRDGLGFSLVSQAYDGERVFWCRLARGGASIMLQQAEAEDGPARGRGRGVTFYFVVDDVDLLYQELLSRGLQLEAPEVAYYGMKQLFVPEPNGYSICFESPRHGRSE